MIKSSKQWEMKFEPRIKLNHNIYTKIMLIILIKRIKDSKDFKGEGWGYVFSTGITLQSFITSESGNQILQFQKKKTGQLIEYLLESSAVLRIK